MVRHGIDPHLNWTRITRMEKNIHKTRNSPLSECRQKFPIMLSESLTIHESEEASYNECVINVKKDTKSSLLYVGVSLLTKIIGLCIVSFNLPNYHKKTILWQ